MTNDTNEQTLSKVLRLIKSFYSSATSYVGNMWDKGVTKFACSLCKGRDTDTKSKGPQ